MRTSAVRKTPPPPSAEAFRRPMIVSEIYLYKNKDAFPACPQCRLPLDREYQAYCDRCGQALGWQRYKKARVVPIP